MVGVAQAEGGGVNQHPFALFGFHREPPENRLGKRFLDRTPLLQVGGSRAVILVRLHQQNFGAAPFKAHDMGAAELPAIQANVVGADAGGQGMDIEKICIPAGDFEINMIAFRVMPGRKITRQGGHAPGFFRDCGCRRS